MLFTNIILTSISSKISSIVCRIRPLQLVTVCMFVLIITQIFIVSYHYVIINNLILYTDEI